MNRKSLWIVLCVLVMASLILSACSPAATPAPQPAAPEATTAPAAQKMATIRWRTRPDNQAEQDVYQTISNELSKKLEAQGIQLQYDPAPAQGYVDKLTTEYSTGNAPDIAWVDGANTADFTSQGFVLDLKPLADADAIFKVADYIDTPMKELEQGGKLWGLPRDSSTLVMYYNKDLFKAKGLEDPADLAAKGQWNWDAFRLPTIPRSSEASIMLRQKWRCSQPTLAV